MPTAVLEPTEEMLLAARQEWVVQYHAGQYYRRLKIRLLYEVWNGKSWVPANLQPFTPIRNALNRSVV